MRSSDVFPFEWIGGHPVLDFVNTVTWRRRGLERERLRSYLDLIRWTRTAGLLPATELAQLERAIKRERLAARSAYRAVVRLRQSIHDVLLAQATGRPIPPAAIAYVSDCTAKAVANTRLSISGRRIRVGWANADRLDRALWPLLKALIDLLDSKDVVRLRVCANPDCGWLFLDRSRKGNRRWCSMSECGSRAKARAYYHRHHRSAIS